MSTIINYKCVNCDFEFQDMNLVFYIDNDNDLQIEPLSLEVSKKMTKSPLSGYLYENYCADCKEIIKTFVPEMENSSFTKEEIEKILNKEKNTKILYFDFKNTFYKQRRDVLENNSCPNCNNKMSLVISDKIPCPICGDKLEEIQN